MEDQRGGGRTIEKGWRTRKRRWRTIEKGWRTIEKSCRTIESGGEPEGRVGRLKRGVGGP